MGWPKGRESQGHGVFIVVVGVMSYQGKWESHLQGEGEQVIKIERTARYARCEKLKQY